MDPRTKAELELYQKEIDTLERHRKIEFIIAMVMFGVALILLIVLIVLLSTGNGTTVATFIIVISLALAPFLGTLILLIRSLVTDVKIANRKRIINRENSIEEEINKPHDENNKIGF